MRPILELHNLSGGYGDVDIIHNINLRVDPGEVVAIVGPNGSGKSTVLRAVFGLLRISSGSWRVNGEDLSNFRTTDIVRLGVCYVPQVGNIFPSLTVAENLELGGYVQHEMVDARMRQIYDIFPPLREKRNVAAGTLSGGQRQMVAIGKALMPEPQILLLDEPSAGLAPAVQDEVFEIIQGINLGGVPILMVEQNARRALEMSDRGYVLVDGRNRAEGPGRQLAADPEIAQAFLGG